MAGPFDGLFGAGGPLNGISGTQKMTAGGPAGDLSAFYARQEALAREQRVREGKEGIDNAFSVFTPDYFANYNKNYLDYYNPQVDQQFGKARQKLRYDLARSGTTDSTGGQKQFGELVDSASARRRDIAASALDATNKVRGQIEDQKGGLYALNTASADPSLSAISAVGKAGSLMTPPAYSPLGDLFSGLANGGAAFIRGRNAGLPSGYGGLFSPGSGTPGGSGSGSVVN